MLAAGALVASILAVGASPAAAAEQNADAQATWTACLGPAKASHGFTDVDMGSVHYDNINCLAYYGITTGKTADTYDPQSSVTRSQMSLFLTRMAKVAGVDLGDVMDAGFSDLGMTDAERVAAINRLAAKGIMEGRTATTFDPEGLVTRADMAQHLFAFADLALDSIHIDTLPITVDGDGTGIELNVANGDGDPVDDYFGDARRSTPAHVDEIIGAVYELGITTGTNGMAGASGTFEPTKPVNRAQMASFIMRTLGHTNLRPAGVTAQQTRNETQVSVRDADHKPIAGAHVELFTTSFADDVFDARGQCIDRYVSNSGFSFETGDTACEIDPRDVRTDSGGNHVFPIGSAGRPTTICTVELMASGLSDPDTKYGVWAWTGEFGDIVDDDTELVSPEGANSKSGLRTPATALFSGGTSNDLKMGRDTLTYTIQLLDRNGNPVGPEPDVNRSFSVTTYVINDAATAAGAAARTTPRDLSTVALPATASKVTEVMWPDSSGRILISIPHPDTSGPLVNGADVLVVVAVDHGPGITNGLPITDAAYPHTRYAAGPALVAGTNVAGKVAVTNVDDATLAAMNWGAAVFSDDDPVPASYTISTRTWGRQANTGNRTEVTLTLLDQYGRPHSSTDSANVFQVDPTVAGGTDQDAVYGSVGSDGIARIIYTDDVRTEDYGANANTIGVAVGSRSGTPLVFAAFAPAHLVHTPVTAADTPKVYWADPGSDRATPDPITADGENIVRVVDPAARSLVLGGGAAGGTATGDVRSYSFGTDDTFMVGMTPVSFAQFMEVLEAANNPDNTDIRVDPAGGTTLAWTGYDVARPRDRAEWTLDGICG